MLTLGLRPALARASSGGITGHSGKQNDTCNACHNGGSAPTVGFDGPSQVAAGETVTLTFSVHAANPAQRAAGFNVATQNNGGTLAIIAGQGARLVVARNELTHSEPKRNDDERNASWQFRWTAPSAPGSYRLFGAGNSVNLNRNNSGDRGRATTFDIDVVATNDTPTATPTATATPPPPTASDTPSPTATQPAATVTGTATSTNPPPTATATPTTPNATATSTATVEGATPAATATATDTPPPDATATATPTGGVSCAGDCDGDGQVAINELVIAVSIALDVQTPATCPAADGNADGEVSIAELIAAVNAALDGC